MKANDGLPRKACSGGAWIREFPLKVCSDGALIQELWERGVSSTKIADALAYLDECRDAENLRAQLENGQELIGLDVEVALNDPARRAFKC